MTGADARPRRAVAAGAILVLVLISGCGVELNDAGQGAPSVPTAITRPPERSSKSTTSTSRPPGTSSTTSTQSTTTSTPDETTSPLDPAFRDGLVKGLVDAGLTEEQANCLADGYESLGVADPTAAPNFDPSTFVDLFDQCGISPSAFGNSGSQGGD